VEAPARLLVLGDDLSYPLVVSNLHASPFLQTDLTSLVLLAPLLIRELDGLNDPLIKVTVYAFKSIHHESVEGE